MKRLLLTVLISAALALPGLAKVYKIPKEDSVVSVDIPKGWKVEYAEDSLDITSDDEEVYLNLEVNDSESLEGAIEETIGYLKKNKVKVDKSTEKKGEGKFGPFSASSIQWDGTDADGPTHISLTFVEISKKKVLTFLYWASPEGGKKHSKDLDAIGDSLKKL
jgi:hypothetical protein